MTVLFHFVGGHSHAYPLFPLARAVARVGIPVAFAAPPGGRRLVAEAGFPFHALPAVPLDRAGAPPDSVPERRARALAAFRDYLRAGESLAGPLASVAADTGARVVVRETAAWAGWLAAGRTGATDVLFDYAPTPPRLATDLLGPDLAAAWRRAGLPGEPGPAAGHRHLLAAPPGWYPRSCFGPGTRLYRPPVAPARALGQAPAGFPARSDRPYAYLTMGSMFHTTPGVLAAMAQACAAVGLRAVANGGPPGPTGGDPAGDDPAGTGSAAATEAGLTVTGFLPQDLESLLVAGAAAVVGHAGYGTLMTALAHGRPIVCVPLGGADNAMRATQLTGTGAGVVVEPADLTAEAIAAALTTVTTDGRFRARAAAIAAANAAQPGLDEAATEILAAAGVPA